MEQLPKIVQQRLSAADKAGVHPDPDLLTAFAERSLNERERVQVLQHLGGCADCRNIVSLAMPEDVAPPIPGVTAATSSARSRWLSWPVLRWGALGACVIVVGAAVTHHYDRQSVTQFGEQPERQATAAESPKIAAAPESRANSAVQSPAPIQPGQKLAEKNPSSLFKSDRAFESASKLNKRSLDKPSLEKQRDDASAEARFAAPAVIGGVEARRKESQPQESGAQPTEEAGNAQLADTGRAKAGRANSSPANSDELKSLDKPSAQSAGNLVAVAPAAPPAPESKGASAEGQAREQAGKAGTDKDEKQQSEKRSNDKDGSERPIGVVNETVTVMADAPVIETATAEVASAKGKSGKKKNKALSTLNSAVRWTLSPDGAVQRSLDSGKTWQTIPVAVGVVFRALAANADDIWVGGSGGALYHSSDRGERWTQVNPAAGGGSSAGDIVGIEFADSRNGKVITSSRVSWSTSDGGATWHRN